MSQCSRLTDLVSSAPERGTALPTDLATHAAECVRCRETLTRSRRLVGLLDHAWDDLEPSPHAVTRAIATARARSTPAGGARNRAAGPSVRVWGPLGAALALAGCVGLIVWYAQGRMAAEPTDAETAAPQNDLTAEHAPSERKSAPDAQRPEPVLTGLAVTGCEAEDESTCRPGTLLRADKTVRRVTLSDQTTLTLNHGSEVQLVAGQDRTLEVRRGEVLIDVVKQAPLPPLTVNSPNGTARVTGTQLQVTSTESRTLVDVLRGTVMVGDQPVGAGQEAVLVAGARPIVRAAPDLAEATRWSELDDSPEEGTMGLGRLSARRPGQDDDTERALRLVDHRVDVRIQGHLARTRIEEAFHNDTKHTLEGIYTFPLPPGARIAELQLLVDGEWHDGAMVERERAEKIWRGVIRNAAPKQQKKEIIEYIWVPGPWRDPALLTWRAGSTFELRIFPIEPGSERRVRIAWVEDLPTTPGGHRYTYPLAQPKDAQTRAEHFRFDAQLGAGVDASAVRTAPYAMQPAGDSGSDGARLHFEAKDFVPSGDLIIDLPRKNPVSELSSWTYQPPGESSGYALFELRPELGDGTPTKAPGNVLFVVDTSYATQAARLDRAGRLIARITRSLSADTQVHVVGCASECRDIGPGFRAAGSVVAADLAQRLRTTEPLGATWLNRAFEHAAELLKARATPRDDVRVIYIGDGVAAMGETEPARVAVEAARALSGVRTSIVSVGGDVDDVMLTALGRETGSRWIAHRNGDTLRRTALRVVRQLTDEPLRDVVLRLPDGLTEITPAELATMWPGEEHRVAARLPAAGVSGPVVLSGTLRGAPFERRWTVELKPTADRGNAFLPRVWAEQRIDELQHAGDAHGDGHREEIVAISRKHHVLSRYTSMLVLESPAMARAFKVDDTRPAVEWTGADESTGAEAESHDEGNGKSASHNRALGAIDGFDRSSSGLAGVRTLDAGGRTRTTSDSSATRDATPKLSGASGTGAIRRLPRKREARISLGKVGASNGALSSNVIQRVIRQRARELRYAYERQLKRNPSLQGRVMLKFTIGRNGQVTQVDASGGEAALRKDLERIIKRWRFPGSDSPVTVSYPIIFQTSGGNTGSVAQIARRNRGGRMLKRKKIWVRAARLSAHRETTGRERDTLAERRAALRETPDSRDRLRDLVRWTIRTGDLKAADQLVEQWLEKDRMDAGALVTASDLAALRGDDTRSRLLLASAVDADPRNAEAHERMIGVFDALDDPVRGCAHRLTRALIARSDWKAQADAVRCGQPEARLFDSLSKRDRRRATRRARKAAKAPRLRGSLRLAATWESDDGDVDVDLVVITPKGRGVSWQGGARITTAIDAQTPGRESLGLSTGELGRYQVFVVPPADFTGRLRGKVVVRAHGERRTYRFDGTGPQPVADVVVSSHAQWKLIQ